MWKKIQPIFAEWLTCPGVDVLGGLLHLILMQYPYEVSIIRIILQMKS